MRCGIIKSEIEKIQGGVPARRYNDSIKVACKCAYRGDRRTFAGAGRYIRFRSTVDSALASKIRLLDQNLGLVIVYQPRAAVRAPGFKDNIWNRLMSVRTSQRTCNRLREHLPHHKMIRAYFPTASNDRMLWFGGYPTDVTEGFPNFCWLEFGLDTAC